jgi:hypothetical protein
MFGKAVFSEKENRLNKISIVWIYVTQVRKNKTRWCNKVDCNKLLVARGEERVDGNYSKNMKQKRNTYTANKIFRKNLEDFRNHLILTIYNTT